MKIFITLISLIASTLGIAQSTNDIVSIRGLVSTYCQDTLQNPITVEIAGMGELYFPRGEFNFNLPKDRSTIEVNMLKVTSEGFYEYQNVGNIMQLPDEATLIFHMEPEKQIKFIDYYPGISSIKECRAGLGIPVALGTTIMAGLTVASLIGRQSNLKNSESAETYKVFKANMEKAQSWERVMWPAAITTVLAVVLNYQYQKEKWPFKKRKSFLIIR